MHMHVHVRVCVHVVLARACVDDLPLRGPIKREGAGESGHGIHRALHAATVAVDLQVAGCGADGLRDL